MKHNICVAGAFGFISPHYDGQTIKSRNLLTLLQEKNVDVGFFEAQRLRVNRFSVFQLFWKVITCKNLYYLPAQNNLTYLFPVIYWLAKLFNTRIHYFVVGGWLVEFLEGKPKHRKMLANIAGVHCETVFMKEALENIYGFENVDVFPNFRINDFHPTPHHEKNKLRLVFMARVIKMKGLDLIFELGNRIIEKGFKDQISIDFYGPQQDENKDVVYFDTHIMKYPFMKYYGPLEPSAIYTALEKYDAMLFPTHFFTEGLPGSILDAYISGIPVIATKWKHATEFIEDGKTGIIIPFDDDGTMLAEAVMKLYVDTNMLNQMKVHAKEKWHEFSSEKAWELLQNYI